MSLPRHFEASIGEMRGFSSETIPKIMNSIMKDLTNDKNYGIIMGMMNRNTLKLRRGRVQKAISKNNHYVTANFYTPKTRKTLIAKALPDRDYTITWNATMLSKCFPKQQWHLPYGDFFGFYVKFNVE